MYLFLDLNLFHIYLAILSVDVTPESKGPGRKIDDYYSVSFACEGSGLFAWRGSLVMSVGPPPHLYD